MLCTSHSSSAQGATTPSSKTFFSEGIHIGRVWKSPRAKTHCIEAALKSFNGNDYAEFVELVLDERGRMVPSGRRLSISTKRLGQFSQLVGDCYRRASAMGLTPRST